jgi:hypothetical protein
MYKIEYESRRNILFLSVEGYLDSDEISRFIEEFREQVNRLDEGFFFVNDMSRFTPPSENVFLIIKELMELLGSKKPCKVIRIFDPENTGAMVQIFKGEELAEIDYDIFTVSSMEDAMNYIEK